MKTELSGELFAEVLKAASPFNGFDLSLLDEEGNLLDLVRLDVWGYLGGAEISVSADRRAFALIYGGGTCDGDDCHAAVFRVTGLRKLERIYHRNYLGSSHHGMTVLACWLDGSRLSLRWEGVGFSQGTVEEEMIETGETGE